MKNVVIFFSLASSLLFSSPSNNPANPKIIKKGIFMKPAKFSFRAGYEGDFIFDRRLKQEDSSQRVNNFKQYLNSFSFTFNVLNRMDILGTIGQAKLKTDWVIKETEDTFSYLEMETKYSNAYALGVKAIFFEWGNASLSFGGRYSYTNPEILWLAKKEDVYNFNGFKVSFSQCQADLGISYQVEIFTPYILAKYSKAESKIAVNNVVISSSGQKEIKFESKNNFGMALGCNLSNSKFFMLNVEVRLIDEEAFTVSGEFKF